MLRAVIFHRKRRAHPHEVHLRGSNEAGLHGDEYADAWVRASKIIQRTPGAQGTYLHRKIGDPTTLLAIATWESKAHRDAKNDRRDETVRAILDMHAQNCEITVIGEFDEPQWSVLPEPAELEDS